MPLRRHIAVNPEHEQWDRIERWFVRLRALQAKGAEETTIVDYALVVLQQCDAMRDWLKQGAKIKSARDPDRNYKSVESSPIPENEIDRLFATEELELCRAIVDGAKHLTLDRQHVDNHVITDLPFPRIVPGQRAELHPVFVAGGKHYKVFDLCQKCVLRIRGFLFAHGWPALLLRMLKDVGPNLELVPDAEGTPWVSAPMSRPPRRPRRRQSGQKKEPG